MQDCLLSPRETRRQEGIENRFCRSLLNKSYGHKKSNGTRKA